MENAEWCAKARKEAQDRARIVLSRFDADDGKSRSARNIVRGRNGAPRQQINPEQGTEVSAEKVDCNDVRLPVDDGRDVSFIPRDDAGERL